MRRFRTVLFWFGIVFVPFGSARGQEPAPTATPPQPSAVFPAGYRGYDAIASALKRIASEHPDLVRAFVLGRTHEGREIAHIRVGRPDPENRARGPAILIVANLEGDHLVGSEVALRLIERLVKGDGTDPEITAMLDNWTIHVIPQPNPDAAERMIAAAARADLRGNLRLIDRDRDGASGEDGPDDLDGDGMVLSMRIKDTRADLIPDEKDDRILKPAEIAKSQKPIYSLYREGSDDDGDGRIDEDPPTGVHLNRNWPHRWVDFDPETGFSPGAEAETRALIRFVTDHPEIVALIQYGLHDTMTTEPKKPGSTLDDADLPFFVELSRNYATRIKEAAKAPAGPVGATQPVTPIASARRAEPTRRVPTKPGSASTAIPTLDGPAEGAMSEWAYHQLGMLAIGARLWSQPEVPEPAEGQPKAPESGDERWLLWNDKVVGGQAFVPFKPFAHPTLGPVEIGGWKPGVRLNPPADRLDPIADGQLLFLKDVASRLPRLELVDVKSESKGDGVFEISAAVVNLGTLPTALAQAVKTRSVAPVVIRLNAPKARVLVGKPVIRSESIRGLGGREEVRWLVQLPENARSVEIEAGTPRAGRVRAQIPVR